VNDDLVSGNCPVTLALPADFSADQVAVSVLPWDRGGCVHKGYEVKADVSP
jgi:hypothetical protein